MWRRKVLGTTQDVLENITMFLVGHAGGTRSVAAAQHLKQPTPEECKRLASGLRPSHRVLYHSCLTYCLAEASFPNHRSARLVHKSISLAHGEFIEECLMEQVDGMWWKCKRNGHVPAAFLNADWLLESDEDG